MKYILTIMLVGILAGAARAQDSTDRENNALDLVLVQDFQGMISSGVIYLKWNSISADKQPYFLVERSENTGEFQVIAVIRGHQSPGNIPLLNCYTDHEASTGNMLYRIRTVRSDMSESLSDVITINNFYKETESDRQMVSRPSTVEP